MSRVSHTYPESIVLNSDSRNAAVLLLITVLGVLVSVYYAFSNATWTLIIPLFNLPTTYHFLLVAIVIPMIGCILAAVILPRIIASLFMTFKRVTMHGYKNAYVPVNRGGLSLRRWLGRSLLLSLLILGLIAAVVNFIDPHLFMSAEEYSDFLSETGVPQFAPPVTITLAGLIAPLAFGLLAASWALEDAGIIHYSLPTDESKLYEVEPVYRRLSSSLKGYAGLSSILFVISVAFTFWTLGGNMEGAIFTLLIPLFSVLQMIPGYLVYARLGSDYLRKGLPEATRLSESDLHISTP